MGALAAPSPAFMAQMKRLLGLKFAPADLTTHWEALSDMSEPLLAAAVEHAQKTSDEFPSPKALRGYADQLRARVVPLEQQEDRSEPNPEPTTAQLPTGLVIPLKRFWRYYCEDCSDSGWISIWCGPGKAKPWMGYGHCGRNIEHMPHEFVSPCPCVSSNPDIQRRLERDRRTVRGKSE